MTYETLRAAYRCVCILLGGLNMTGNELIEKLQRGMIDALNETGVTNGDGHYIEDCLTCSIGVVLLKAGYNSKQIVRYFTRAAVLLESDKEVDFTKEITNKE